MTNYFTSVRIKDDIAEITLHNGEKVIEISQCVRKLHCEPESFKWAHGQLGDIGFDSAKEVSSCVQNRLKGENDGCDFNTYRDVLNLVGSFHHDHAIEVAKCVAVGNCDFEAYKVVF